MNALQYAVHDLISTHFLPELSNSINAYADVARAMKLQPTIVAAITFANQLQAHAESGGCSDLLACNRLFVASIKIVSSTMTVNASPCYS